MRFLSSLIAGAAVLSSLVAAQSDGLALTNGFSNVQAGEPVEITYTASDLTVPITITLRKGNPLNLDTVDVLTSSATGGSFTWIPATSLTDDDDYALQLTQGDQINYSGQFSVEGGSGSASSSSASSSASSTASSASASASSSTASVNVTSSILSLSSSIISAANSSASSISSAARNSTASLSTLTTSTSLSASATSTTGASSRTASATGSSETSAPTNAASGLKSPVALVFGAIAAMVYLH